MWTKYIINKEGVDSIIHIIFFGVALASMLILMHFQVNFFISLFLSFIILMIINYITAYIKDAFWRKSLDTDCDPEKFLALILKQEKRFRRNERGLNHIAINRAAGYMVQGNFDIAKDILEGIDISYFSEKSLSLIAYHINLISCYYELGEIEKGEALYETSLVRLCPFGKRIKQAVDILVGERFFYLKRYEESYEYLSKLLKADLCKRQYLSIIFRLAQMDIINGEKEKAEKRLNKIVKLGNKLWIAAESKKLLKNIKSSEAVEA